MQLTTYVNFDGNCLEAMTFYAKCLGAQLATMPFDPAHCPGPEGRIMHSSLTKGNVILMASDMMPGAPLNPGNNFTICIDCGSMEEIQTLFAALGENGTVTMPLADSFWGAHFGMLKDQFGIAWMFNYTKPAA